MIRLIKKLWNALLYDEVMVRRWGRALLMALATGGMGFSDQLAAVLGAPIRWIKIAAVIAGFIAVAINLGDKNPPKDLNPPKEAGNENIPDLK